MTDHIDVRRDLTTRMAERAPRLVDALEPALVERLIDLGAEDVDHQSLRASVEDSIGVLVRLIAGAADAALLSPSPRTVSFVQRLARRGVPLQEIIQGWALSEHYWHQAVVEEFLRGGFDDSFTIDLLAVWNESHAFLEHDIRAISSEYEAERSQHRHSSDAHRARLIASLLTEGADGAPADTESRLGYAMHRRHLAIILWAAADSSPGQAHARASQFEHAVTLAARATLSSGPPLVTERDEFTRWGWLALPPHGSGDLADLEGILARECPLIGLAAGEPTEGFAGFVRSHRQARSAQEVALGCSTRSDGEVLQLAVPLEHVDKFRIR